MEENEEEMEVDTSVSLALAPSSSTTSTSSSKVPRHDLMIDENKSRHTFFKQTKSYPMYPCTEEKAKWDDYGEAIR